jgi:hypothetical protein
MLLDSLLVACANHPFFKIVIFMVHGNSWMQQVIPPDRRDKIIDVITCRLLHRSIASVSRTCHGESSIAYERRNRPSLLTLTKRHSTEARTVSWDTSPEGPFSSVCKQKKKSWNRT